MLSEKPGAIVVGCCVGELCGELLAKEERSEEALWMETNFKEREDGLVPASWGE